MHFPAKKIKIIFFTHHKVERLHSVALLEFMLDQHLAEGEVFRCPEVKEEGLAVEPVDVFDHRVALQLPVYLLLDD